MTVFDQQWWDERYSSAPRLWSGHVNGQLVAEVSGLPPGTALDAGAGEGGDALWLAEQGWRVHAVDISTVALERGEAEAGRRGLADRITWEQADLLTWTPTGRYDLVAASFLHPAAGDRRGLLERLGGVVVPGGTLLFVQHAPTDREVVPRPDMPERFATAEELVAELDPQRWEVVTAEARPRPTHHPETGDEVTVHDVVLTARRRGA